MKEEIWKWVPGYENVYEVSNYGNVRSYFIRGTKCGELSGKPTLKSGRLLRSRGNCYYYAVDLFNGDKKTKKTFRVHVLVAMAFKNFIPNGYEFVVDHIDNNALNNHIDNLQVIEQRENTTKDKTNMGVYVGNNNKWFVTIRLKQNNNKKLYFGSYNTPEEAKIIRDKVLSNLDKYENKDQYRELILGYKVVWGNNNYKKIDKLNGG
jgi:hypothetical protein